MSETNLLNYLKTLDQHIVKSSINNPDKNPYDALNKEKLLNIYNDNNFNEYTSKNKWGENIKINEFINYVLSINSSKTPRGKYHIFMDCIIKYYNLPIINGMPEFDSIPIDIQKKIIPARVEYTIAWYIINRLREHPFIKNYINDEAKITFQERIDPDDNRFYDILFRKLHIVIEIQEDSINHTENDNDDLKKALVLARSWTIKYFKVKMYVDEQFDYLENFSIEIEKSIIDSLLNININIRDEYIKFAFIQYLEQRQTYLSNTYNTNEIKVTKRILENMNSNIITKIFLLKQKCNSSYDKNIISIDEIIELISELNSSSKNIYSDILSTDIMIHKRDGIYTNFGDLIRIIMLLDSDQIMKDTLIIYLTQISNIYEDIICRIKTHLDNRLDIINDMYGKTISHTKKKLEIKYLSKIEQLEKILIFEQTQNNINNKQRKKNNTFATKLLKIISNPIDDIELLKIKSIINEIIDLNGNYNRYKSNDLTIIKHENESILEEIIDFPIIYSKDKNSRIEYNMLKIICKEYGIKMQIIKLICERFCLPNTTV